MESTISIANKQKVAKLPEQINIESINASAIMYNSSKKYSLLTHKNRESIFIQSPIFENIIEIKDYEDYTEYYFEIPNNSNGQKFLSFINDVEQKLIKLAFENKANWFDGKENVKFRSVIKNLDEYDSKIIKFRFPYNIRTRCQYVESFDMISQGEFENISIKDIQGNVRIVLNINAIWFTNDMFGLYIRPVYVEEIRQCEYTFQDQYDNSLFIDSEVMLNENVVRAKTNESLNLKKMGRKLNNSVQSTNLMNPTNLANLKSLESHNLLGGHKKKINLNANPNPDPDSDSELDVESNADSDSEPENETNLKKKFEYNEHDSDTGSELDLDFD